MMDDDSGEFRLDAVDMKNVVLKSSFCGHMNNFNFAHVNPGSIISHIDELRAIVRDVPLHMLGVSESWFQGNKHNSKTFDIPGYTLIRKDRSNKSERSRGGGICIYLKSHLKYRCVYKSPATSLVEYMFLEIENSLKEKMMIAIVYSPPRCDCISKLRRILTETLYKYTNFFIIGDFNYDFLSSSNRVSKFKEFFSENCLYNISNEPTNFQSNSATQIDLLFVRDPNKLLMFSQISLPGITTHDMLYGSYNFHISNEVNCEFKYVRNFANINEINLLNHALSLDWDPIFNATSSDNQVEILNMNLFQLLENHAPYHWISIKGTNEDSFDLETQNKINFRNYLHSKYLRTRSQSDWLNFKSARNKATESVRNFKRKKINKILNPNLPAKKLWKNIKNLGIQNSVSEESKFSPNEFSNYFQSMYSSEDRAGVQNIPVVERSHLFKFRTVTEFEVEKAVKSIKSNAVGDDSIPISFIVSLLPAILPVLTFIFNTCLLNSEFPSAWKIGLVRPLPKVPNPKTLEDYRQITILSGLSKVLERLMANQIKTFLREYGMNDTFQSGFKERHSTITALMSIIDDILDSVECGNVSVLALLDFSKAFDKVPHRLLLKKLKNIFGFSNSALGMIESYLSSRKQIVKFDKCYPSDSIEVTSGVPAGSILGPLLFSIFIWDLPNVLQSARYHVFADDFQIYLSDKPDNIKALVVELNGELQRISEWAMRNGMILNGGKSKAIIISKNKVDSSSVGQLIIGDRPIEWTEKVNSLGIIINNELNWNDHLKQVCSDVYRSLGKLYHFKQFLSTDMKLKLVQALVLPKFTYGAQLFTGSMEVNKLRWNKFRVAFNSCARFIYNKRLGDPITEYSNKLWNCKFDEYFKFISAVQVFKIVHDKEPEYLFNKLKFSRSGRNLNLNLPHSCNTNAKRGSFFVHGVKIWNSLSFQLRTLQTLSSFRAACLEHFRGV